MKTVNMYDSNNSLIIVNEPDVDKYKALGFSRKKRADKKADDVTSMTNVGNDNREESENVRHAKRG